MARIQRPSLDFASLKQDVLLQFEDLDPNDPSRWPPLPRALALFAVTCLVMIGMWFFWVRDYA